MKTALDVPRYRQPFMECGPACLVEVMEYFDNKKYNVHEIVKETKSECKNLDWTFLLGLAAIKRGFNVKVVTLSTELFDPTWIDLKPRKLILKIKKRIEFLEAMKSKDKYILEWNIGPLKKAVEFITSGGELVFSLITKDLIKHYIKKKIPVIVSVNENVFYGIKRTRAQDGDYDDIRGMHGGHMIVISGFNRSNFLITDSEPISDRFRGRFTKSMDHVIISNLIFSPTIMIVYKIR